MAGNPERRGFKRSGLQRKYWGLQALGKGDAAQVRVVRPGKLAVSGPPPPPVAADGCSKTSGEGGPRRSVEALQLEGEPVVAGGVVLGGAVCLAEVEGLFEFLARLE